ncbi:ribonuclease domain-containing protein [Luteipulveratus halotolerans]|uniref:Uncharacterized protein n=1 Tax=Luteipulveratus halotolerans TaxID=1631356 RepID=A0A0L6CJ80_9MICO|nr:ribonuclease domain-containing protein [Luteipulveratus halotolerans]KNX37852.1 hypothetical protein VV01_12925 [Luteipulveratus halotolerans]
MADAKSGLAWVWKNWVLVIVSLLLLILVIVWGARGGTPDEVIPTTRPAATADSSAGASGAASDPTGQQDDLPTIAYADLPREAKTTLGLIARGGPYPYKQDGMTFRNRERLLPADGRYQEFTVVTPDERDRGARRIIKERRGTLYYTDDHYESFKRIRR